MSYIIKYLYIKLLILHIPGFPLVGEEWVAWDRGQVQKGQKRILIALSWEEKKCEDEIENSSYMKMQKIRDISGPIL